jgi:hypothetical protein
MATTSDLKLTVYEIARYAPYHTFPAFKPGYDDYFRPFVDCLPGSPDGVEGQAYDRGAECAMRRAREAKLPI